MIITTVTYIMLEYKYICTISVLLQITTNLLQFSYSILFKEFINDISFSNFITFAAYKKEQSLTQFCHW